MWAILLLSSIILFFIETNFIIDHTRLPFFYKDKIL